MIIALDYDGTFTADREGWSLFVHMMKQRGHSITFVTFRTDFFKAERADVGRDPDNADIREDAEKLGIEIVFSGGRQKKHVFKADVWIDDMPELIPSFKELTSMTIGCLRNGDTQHA